MDYVTINNLQKNKQKTFFKFLSNLKPLIFSHFSKLIITDKKIDVFWYFCPQTIGHIH